LVINEVGETPIATEGDEVVASFSLIALQAARHERIVTQDIVPPKLEYYRYPTHDDETVMNGAPKGFSHETNYFAFFAVVLFGATA
jgi:hypothetical protein